MDELLLQVAESLRKTLALSAAEVWTGSGGRLERTVSVPDVPVERLASTQDEQLVVARAGVTGTAWLEVWLPAMLEGRQDAVLRVAPTTHSGQVLGLIVAVRPPGGDQFTTDDDTMLTELARQVGLALHNVELDSALQESLEEVRRQADELQASRARIVAAVRRGPPPDRAEPARRGPAAPGGPGRQRPAGPQAGRDRPGGLPRAARPAGPGPPGRRPGAARPGPRHLPAAAHRPGARGGAARRGRTGRAARPRWWPPDLGRYSAETEAAAYFCCMEALQNAGKHAGEGASATVRVWEEGDRLFFEVADTGAGFDMAGRGRQGGRVRQHERPGRRGRRDPQRGFGRRPGHDDRRPDPDHRRPEPAAQVAGQLRGLAPSRPVQTPSRTSGPNCSLCT